MTDRPEIVCICGSARFMAEMRAANRDLTFAGVIVVAPSDADESPTPEQKVVLDALHQRKIDLGRPGLDRQPRRLRRRVDAQGDRLRRSRRQADHLHRSHVTTRAALISARARTRGQ